MGIAWLNGYSPETSASGNYSSLLTKGCFNYSRLSRHQWSAEETFSDYWWRLTCSEGCQGEGCWWNQTSLQTRQSRYCWQGRCACLFSWPSLSSTKLCNVQQSVAYTSLQEKVKEVQSQSGRGQTQQSSGNNSQTTTTKRMTALSFLLNKQDIEEAANKEEVRASISQRQT